MFLGDHSLVREGVVLGAGASIGHGSTVGRDARIGERVRTQGYAALAAGVVIEDDAFLGPLVSVLAGLTMRAARTPARTARDPPSCAAAATSAAVRRSCRVSRIGERAGVDGAEDAVVVDDVAGAGVRGVPAR